MKIRIGLSIVSALAVVTVAAYLHSAWGNGVQQGSSNQSTVKIQRRDMNLSIIATGVIKPKAGAEVKVGAQVSGVVQNLYVRTGTLVKKNDLLAVIDPRSYLSQKEKMSALKDIAATELKYAEMDLQRQQKLFRQESISQLQYEAATQRVELAKAKLHQAQADDEYADLQISYTRICSPIDGVVASITTQEGETVTSGFIAPTFVTIIDLQQLELYTYVDETDIGRITKGQSVSFTVDTYPGEQFNGIVETIYPKPEILNSVVNYVTVVSIQHKSHKTLRPEMTASVQVVLEQRHGVLTVPKNAIQTDANGSFVNVSVDGTSKRRNVTTGASDKRYTEVLSGVSENEMVLINQ